MSRRHRIETLELAGVGPRVLVSRTKTEPADPSRTRPPLIAVIPSDTDPAIASAADYRLRIITTKP
jgi:hypothetical protein